MKIKFCFILLSALTISSLSLVMGCFGTTASEDIISSRAYSGHESDIDANNLVQAYPNILGTRLDDCQTCHGGGIVDTGNGPKTIANPCSYCHIRVFESPADYISGYPDTYEDTLNPYGLAYNNAGKNKDALLEIADSDSDGDGFSNKDEIDDLRYPGDDSSLPGQPLAPVITLTWNQVSAMTYHDQFMLLNATKQQYDDYTTYGGVKISDFFTAAGVDLAGATGFTVFAPDGYQIDFIFADFDYLNQFPDGIYYEVADSPDPLLNFINYSDALPSGIQNEDVLTNLWMIIAYKRDGQNLDPSYYDSTDGRIGGEGPYRIIRPQKSNDNGDTGKPFRPDRGSRSDQADPDDGWNFLGFDYDHNAGDAVKGTCVIRIDPMPAGYEEYDWKNGWSLIDDKKIIIYGHNIN